MPRNIQNIHPTTYIHLNWIAQHQRPVVPPTSTGPAATFVKPGIDSRTPGPGMTEDSLFFCGDFKDFLFPPLFGEDFPILTIIFFRWVETGRLESWSLFFFSQGWRGRFNLYDLYIYIYMSMVYLHKLNWVRCWRFVANWNKTRDAWRRQKALTHTHTYT